jgi:uncharacterized protein (DUF305 family)
MSTPESERSIEHDAEQHTEPDADGDDGDDDDGTIVLPWWQHPVNIFTLVITAALLAGIAGWMIGDSGGRTAHNEVDTGFLQDMREHHEQGVLISSIYQALPDTDPGLRVIAGSIVQGQTLEVGRMIQMLRDFGEAEANEGETSMAWMGEPTERGNMPGMASDDALRQLQEASGPAADQIFADLMIAHHQGAIHMAEHAEQHGQSDVVASFAASIADSQADEITEIEGELAG